MIKILVILLLMICSMYAKEYQPISQIQASGIAKDMVLKDDKLYIGTDHGMLQVYDLKSKKFIKHIDIPKVKDFMGDEIFARVSSVDFYDGRYLLLSDSGKGGYTNLWLHENNTTKQLLSAKDKRALVKARFIDKEHILLGYLGNEASLLDVNTKKERYRVQLSESKFSDFALNEDRSRAVFSCESGILYVIDTKTGKVIKELKGQNLDNVYKVDYKNHKVSAAGQDRRGSIYDVDSGKGEYIQGSFLIYATGLSPSARLVAFAMDEQNNISIYNVSTKSKIALLKGQKSTLNTIIFKDEETLFSSSDDKTIMQWKLK